VNTIESLTTDLRGILDERSAHWPFKRKSKLGKTGVPKFGPPPSSTRSVKKADDWVCKKKGKYTQLCRGPEGQKKIVKIDAGYKKGYNAAYRKWKASQTKKKSKKS
jgi:hypothetical protein